MKINSKKTYKFNLHEEFDKKNFDDIIKKLTEQRENTKKFLTEEQFAAVENNSIHRKRSAPSTLQVNNRNETLLHRFAGLESNNAMQYFVRVLNFGEANDINSKTVLGLRPIHYAILSGNNERVASIVRMGASLSSIKNQTEGLAAFAKRNDLNNNIIAYLESEEFRNLVTIFEPKASRILEHTKALAENKQQKSKPVSAEPTEAKETIKLYSQDSENSTLSRTNTMTSSSSSGVSGITNKIGSTMLSLNNSNGAKAKVGIENWLIRKDRKVDTIRENLAEQEVINLTIDDKAADKNLSTAQNSTTRQISSSSSSSATTSSEDSISQEFEASNSRESNRFVSALKILRNENNILKNRNAREGCSSSSKYSRSIYKEESSVLTVYDLSDSENYDSNIGNTSRYESPLPSRKRVDTKETPDRLARNVSESSSSEAKSGSSSSDKVKNLPENFSWTSRIQESSNNRAVNISR